MTRLQPDARDSSDDKEWQRPPRLRTATVLRTGAEQFTHDLRFGVRLMRRSPAFAFVAMLTLGLGIGANTAIYSLADVAFLRPLPVRNPEQLVLLEAITKQGEELNVSYPLYRRIREDADVFTGVFAALDGVNRVSMVAPDAAREAEQVALQLVSGEYFDVLGVVPRIGRTLRPADDVRSGAPVAVLSHAFWKRRFGGDPNVLGKSVQLQQQSFTVVGVTQPGFFGEAVGLAPDVWVPLTTQPLFDRGASLLDRGNVGWLRIMGRLRPDQTVDHAAAALAVLLPRFQSDATDVGARHLARIRAVDGSHGTSGFRERHAPLLRILAAVVVILLLITCANVSGLLLVRATVRQREVAVRLALGAGRTRLVRQFLTENLLLGVVGGVLGVFFAWWGTGALLALASNDVAPIAIDVTPNLRTLAIATAISVLVVLVIGIAPAAAATRQTVGPSLRMMARARERAGLSPILVTAQIALSLMLLIGAAVFVQTFRNLRTVDLGFAGESLLQLQADPTGYTPEAFPTLMRQLVERLNALPGVESVAQAHSGFQLGMSNTCCIAVPGYVHAADEDRQIETVGVAPGYFDVLRLRLLQGRDFTDAEASAAARVAIVNEAFARRYFGVTNAVGQRFGWGTSRNVTYGEEIIGVVSNARYGELRAESKPLLYFPDRTGTVLTIRTAGAPERLIAPVRREIQRVDPQLEIFGISTISRDLERALVRESLLAKLSAFFGALAVGLAALGVYGLMAHAVASRTHAIGIRMALGATRVAVLRAEMQSVIKLLAIGVAMGASAAFAASQVIKNQLYGVSVTDPAVAATAIVLLALVAGVAAYLPARRAARVDPMVVLRHE